MRALPLLLLAGCATTSATTSGSSAATLARVEAAEAHTTQRTTGGAVDWRVETWEYVPAAEPRAGRQPNLGGAAQGSIPGTSGVAQLARAPAAEPGVAGSSPAAEPLPGTLLRHSIATAHVAPVAVVATTDARSLTETHAQATEARTTVADSRPAWSPPAWAWVLLPAVLLALVIVALWLWRRFG